MGKGIKNHILNQKENEHMTLLRVAMLRKTQKANEIVTSARYVKSGHNIIENNYF